VFINYPLESNMKKLLKLMALAFIVIGISACGKMGELEAVKADQVVLSPVPTIDQAAQATAPAIDQAAQATAPELDILPHNSK
jgi:predicted small lipoprotein YifL